MNVRRTSAAALSAALLTSSTLLAAPASAATPCDGVTASSSKVHNMVNGVPATHRIRLLGVECHPRDTLQRVRLSYSDPPGGLAFCKAIDSITWNVGQIGSYNPPPKRLPCNIDGASVELEFPDQTFGPGKTDRCAGAHVKIVVGGFQPDQEFDIPKVCFPS